MSNNIKKIELAEIQKGIYFDCQMDDPVAYNISGTYLLENIQENHLENACKIVISEQEALRSSIIMDNDYPCLIIHEQLHFHLAKQSIVSNPNSEKLINAIVQEEIGAPIDLNKAPLFRMKLLHLEESKYLLIICIHHLIADGLSLDILIKKILHYHHQLIQREAILLKKDTGFSNFIRQENIKLRNNEYTKQKSYWMQKMQNVEPLHLQTDYPKGKNTKGIGKVKTLAIPKELSKAIHSLAMEQEVTVFTLFLAAFTVMISRYAQSEDITLASPFSYRPDLDLEETIGCFVYMLPMRFHIAGNESFSGILHHVAKEFIEIYKNIGYPNNLIIRDNLTLSADAGSIFDVSFVYDIYETIIEGDARAQITDQDAVTFPGTLMVILNKIASNDFIKIQYKPDLFTDETIELMGLRYIQLLNELVSDPDALIDSINWWLGNEKTRVLKEFNQSSYFSHLPKTIIDIFQDKVLKNPQRTALIDNQKTITYSLVNSRSNHLAHKILQHKTKVNECIGIQLERSIDLVISILAILKAGCAYVFIEPTYPAARKEFIFKDADISLLITSQYLPRNYSHELQFIFADDNTIYEGVLHEINHPQDPFNLAYIAYTSGSTGSPKGVMIENHSVVNTLLDLERRFPVAERDVYLLKTPLTFDISVTELFGWFIGEGSLFILEPNGEKNLQLIINAIAEHHITHINFVPSMFRLFLELLELKSNINKLQSLKWIFLGGEKVTFDLVEKYRSLIQGSKINIQLENMYGPTECSLWATHFPIQSPTIKVPIGKPLNETRCYVVGKNNQLQPIGIPGELCLSGVGLARGYLNLEQMTQEKFIENPFFEEGADSNHYHKMYRTGDRVRWLSDGNLDFLGRTDSQLKIRGMRLELEEIEKVLAQYPGIIQAIVVVKEELNQLSQLCAYYVAEAEISDKNLKEFLSSQLPAYMIPAFYIHKSELPLTSSGKVNRKILTVDKDYKKKITATATDTYKAPQSDLENKIAAVWQEVLGVDSIGLDSNFFEIGGHSLSLLQVNNKLRKLLNVDFSVNLQFQLPTIRLLAEYFSKNVIITQTHQAIFTKRIEKKWQSDIAIIGLSVNVPGAQNIQEFWDILKNGKESIYFYQDEELIKLGIPLNTLNSPHYVKAKGRVEGIEHFDHAFFEYTPAEIHLMSPQLRLLYPGIWEVLEDAGYYPNGDAHSIGLFIGASDDFEWYKKTLFDSGPFSDKFQALTLSTNHFLATRLAYKLDIRGPVFSALTGCSTTLMTAHLACQSLLLGECDLAITGGITVELPNDGGYFYEEGMMFSPDGHCRPFDALAGGTMFTNGMGLAVLKRLDEALEDGDHIYAVIKGSAINNDGKQKLGYTAPSPIGQAKVIEDAYCVAGIDPATVSYVEAHGTGTILGDPIEVESLTNAFATTKKQFCVLGSVKGNIGHTDTAAGIVGLSKVALSLKHKYIPGTVNFTQPNPKIDFANTPFIVKSEGAPWESKESLLRAGINSFGVGGTNVHMVLEQAPTNRFSSNASQYNLLLFSAKSANALAKTSERIVKFLQQNPTVNLSDVAWTLQVGRKHFSYRKCIVENQNCFEEFPEEMLKALDESITYEVTPSNKNIYFLFSGLGSQYVKMGHDLYFAENSGISAIYQRYFNQVINLLPKEEHDGLLNVLYGTKDSKKINETEFSQMALFSVSYALANSLIELGIKPKAMLGHSIGEITAATIAGDIKLNDAIEIVKQLGYTLQQQSSDPMVNFSKSLSEILKDEEGIFIEVGPGYTLSAFARQHEAKKPKQHFINLMRHSKERVDDIEYIYKKIGQIWCVGADLDWHKLRGDAIRHRLSLPTYVFDKEYFPIENKIGLQDTVIDKNLPDQLHKSTLPLEVAIIDAYQTIFGFTNIDRDQDFFALGGDSLKAVSLGSHINRKLNIKIDIKDLFQYSTPAALAGYLNENNNEKINNRDNNVIMPIAKREYYPLSSAQSRMYTLYLLDKMSLAYNLPSAFLINGALNISRFEQSFKKLIERHEPLRTTISLRDNQLVQIVHSSLDFKVNYFERHANSNEEINSLIVDFIKPFDLNTGPLFRVELVKLNSEHYLFLLDIHHIIADGTSMEIFTRDFNNLYAGNQLEPLVIQYRDFAVWHNSFLHSETIREQKDFWLEYLSGDLPVLELPTDYPRPVIKNFSGDRIYFDIDEALTRQLIDFSKSCGTTLFMTLISAWYVLLARLSGQDEIIVGVPISGRNQKEIEETIGMFINMLALRNRPTNEKRFIDFLTEVKNNVLNAFKNQDYQFDELIQNLTLKRELSRNALFDVCFDFQNMEFFDFEIDNIHFTPYQFAANSATHDLVLTCQENKRKSSIEGFLEYATGLFKKETMERWIESFKIILRHIIAEKATPIGDIDILSVEERQLIVEKFNDTRLPFESFVTIDSLFRKNVENFPNKIALIVSDGKEFTYAQLNEKANILSENLIKVGATQDSLVGVMTDRDETLFIALLGILKARAAYVPIDPNFPAERIQYMLSQADIKLLISPQHHANKISFTGKIIDPYSAVTADLSRWGNETKINIPDLTPHEDKLACIIFTSGSTGKPKGVMVNQSSIINFIEDIKNREIFKNPEDRIISVTTISFDIFSFESLVPLCTGHSVYLADKTEQLDPALANNKILKYHVTHLLSTISRIKLFIENSEFLPALKQLQCILSGGENFPLPLLKALQNRAQARIYNMYGPTETTIWSTTKDLTHADTINIGKPIANTQAYIINEAKKLQPIGVFGELCLTGAGLARGYLHNAEETNQKFIRLSEIEQTLCYRTGDQARFLANGEIELKGRMDSQIKIRGYRIELDEIEKVAETHDHISQVACIAYDDTHNNKQLALYYCIKNGENLKCDNICIKAWLENKLPHYMLPSYLMLLESMPTLPNGKINKKALPLPQLNIQSIEVTTVSSDYNMEQILLALWREVLSVNTISINDNFFDVGGNSLGLMQINNKLNLLLQEPIPLLQLFEYPTIASFVKSLNLPTNQNQTEPITTSITKNEIPSTDIAVIGLACKFPGAQNIDEFWQNIISGTESITQFNDEDLIESGIYAELLDNPNYIKAKGFLDGVEYFDSAFFDYTDRDANNMDPQIRVLHQCAWEVLENAAYNPATYDGRIGIFAGSGSNILWVKNLLTNDQDLLTAFEYITLNEKDYLTTRLSYKLNLKGPSFTIQTACSTSLVAIHQAAQSLINGECEMAIAGGVSISYPRKEGYLWHEGMIFSRDGHCKPFSDESSGIIPGNGCGLVMLKPLKDAIRDKDHIYAVIKGSAINNDGIEKVGYTAPSIAGQRFVIETALKKAKVKPEDICYLETHGTGTKIGDPIEIEALKKAWACDNKQFCAIGSVKANIGHLDSAAGVASFIKTVLLIHHRILPPLINFKNPNPMIDFKNSPFYINTEAEHIKNPEKIIRAAVSSFGIGGTNAHVILEQSPIMEEKNYQDQINLLLFSGRSIEALRHNEQAILSYLQNNKGVNLSDVAWTLQIGRKHFEYRKALLIVGSSISNAQVIEKDRSDSKKQIMQLNYLKAEVNNIINFLEQNGGSNLDLIKKLAEIWCEGVEINWQQINNLSSRRRIPLPSYVFDKIYHNPDIVLSKHTASFPFTHVNKSIGNITSLGQNLKLIWNEIFGLEVKEQDDFFALGGDSLKATLLAAQIQKICNIEMTVAEIFNHSIFNKMVDWLHSQERGRTNQRIFHKIPLIQRQAYYPTSSAQKRIYAVHQLLEGAIPYNLAEAYVIEGNIDKEKFKKALDSLVQRHEAFRTRFDIIDGEVVQIIEDEVETIVEFEISDESQIQNKIINYMRPFDLHKCPLVRIKLISISEIHHILLIDMHHIIADQSSIIIIIRELADLYSGKSLQPLTIQYKDFAAWQNSQLKDKNIESQISYWKNEFKAPIPVLNIPTDFLRPTVQSFAGDRITFNLDSKLSLKINQVSNQYSITPYMIFMAAFKLLLWKYSGQEDLVVGTAVTGRRHADLTPIVGMFVNTLGIRTQINDALTIIEYLQYIKRKMLDAYDNQDCQFEVLLESLNLEKDLSRNPLFDVVINYIDMGNTNLILGDLIIKPWPNTTVNAKFDLTLTVEKNNNNYLADIEFNIALFERETINNLIRRLTHILEFIIEHTNSQLSELTLISPSERNQLLYDLNQNNTDYPRDKTVIDIFNQIVADYGNNIALIWNDIEISYHQLNEKINNVAALLIKNNVAVGDRIGILLNRNPLQIIAIFAILKVGGTYIPIDPEYPTTRINFILKDSDARLLLTQPQVNLLDIDQIIPFIYLDQNANSKNVGSDELDAIEHRTKNIYPESIAYIMYTSGSTGIPKGILTTHRNIVRLVKKSNFLEFKACDRLLQLSNYVFDGSTFDIYGALLNGASLVIVSKETAIEMSELTQLILENSISVFYINSALFNMLVEYNVACLKNIRKVVIGGEALSVMHIRKAFTYLGPNKLINGYGPTETTVFAAYYPINEINSNLCSVPIGYPLANAKLYVLDKYGHPVPKDIVGELYIGGDGVSQGYLNRKELTEQRFLNDPFSPNGKMYRTGDLVRRLSNNALLFIGRQDFQVKIRGYRVELGEIEYHIREIPGVKNVVVITKLDNTGNPYIAAYYIVDQQFTLNTTRTASWFENNAKAELLLEKNAASINPDQIRKILTDKLPSYMIPSKMKIMSSFPLNENGKVDLRALPDIDEKNLEWVNSSSPRNPIETIIHEQMKKVLDNDNIGINDDFFKYGGHSIKAIAFVHALSQLGIQIKVNQIFLYPTVAKLAALPELSNFNKINLSSVTDNTSTLSDSLPAVLAERIQLNTSQINILVKNIEARCQLISNLISSEKLLSKFPLAPVQKMHLLHSSDFSGFSTILEGNLDKDSVCNRIATIIRNNQLLHSIIQIEQDPMWYEYDTATSASLIENNIPYLDLREYDFQTQQAIIQNTATKLFSTHYQPGMLSWRLGCFRLSQQQHLIIWAFDHVAFDGMSSEIIQNQLKNDSFVILDLIQKYCHYVSLLQSGPENITENAIIKNFSLQKWQEINTEVINKLDAIRKGDQTSLTITLPLNNGSMQSPWQLAFDFVVELLKDYIGIDVIPLTIINYGRSYKTQNFYNCIGEFLDFIPILVTEIFDQNHMARLLEQCRLNAINFISLLYDGQLSQKFPKIFNLLAPAFISEGRTQQLISFNFQGFVSEREKAIFETAMQNSPVTDPLAKLYITANYDETNLHITLDSQNGINLDRINPLIENLTSLVTTLH